MQIDNATREENFGPIHELRRCDDCVVNGKESCEPCPSNFPPIAFSCSCVPSPINCFVNVDTVNLRLALSRRLAVKGGFGNCFLGPASWRSTVLRFWTLHVQGIVKRADSMWSRSRSR